MCVKTKKVLLLVCVCVCSKFIYIVFFVRAKGKGFHIRHVGDLCSWKLGRWRTSKFGPWIFGMYAGARKIVLAWSIITNGAIFPHLDANQCGSKEFHSLVGSCFWSFIWRLHTPWWYVWNENAECSSRWNLTRFDVGLSWFIQNLMPLIPRFGRSFFLLQNFKVIETARGNEPCPCSIKHLSRFGSWLPRKVGKLLRDNQEKLDPNEAGFAVGT